MNRLKRFLRTTFLGGIAVILPVVLTFLFLRWLFRVITDFIEPITHVVVKESRIQVYFAYILVIIFIISVCFFVGLVVRTRFGHFVHDTVEKRILKIAPGYTLFKETIKQFLGQERAPFSQVALVEAFGPNSLMTGFITDRHPAGYYTVYVPSGLNPTTGLILHLETKYVHLLDVPVEETMRSIIGCGAGSNKLVDSFLRSNSKNHPGSK